MLARRTSQFFGTTSQENFQKGHEWHSRSFFERRDVQRAPQDPTELDRAAANVSRAMARSTSSLEALSQRAGLTRLRRAVRRSLTARPGSPVHWATWLTRRIVVLAASPRRVTVQMTRAFGRGPEREQDIPVPLPLSDVRAGQATADTAIDVDDARVRAPKSAVPRKQSRRSRRCRCLFLRE